MIQELRILPELAEKLTPEVIAVRKQIDFFFFSDGSFSK